MSLMTVSRIRAPSSRGGRVPASPIRRLAPLADAAKARGTKVYHLNIGQPDIETPAPMLARLKQLDARVLEYSPSPGTPEFIRSLQRYYERRGGAALGSDPILAPARRHGALLFAPMGGADARGHPLLLAAVYAKH